MMTHHVLIDLLLWLSCECVSMEFIDLVCGARTCPHVRLNYCLCHQTYNTPVDKDSVSTKCSLSPDLQHAG